MTSCPICEINFFTVVRSFTLFPQNYTLIQKSLLFYDRGYQLISLFNIFFKLKLVQPQSFV